MNVTDKILLYLISLGAFLVIDFTWLGWIARDFYANQLEGLMAEDVNWTSAVIFYLLFVVGLLIFVILPALNGGSLAQAVYMGALFGLIAYATYDLTNLATLQNWPLMVTVVDLIWGGTLSAAVSTVGYLAGSNWL